MADAPLKSSVFRREREESWRDLERLVTRWERRGARGLSAAEALRLPTLYRAALSSLSVARAISLDRNVLTYLETLSARAYFCVHGLRTGMLAAIAAFFGRDLPRAMRDAAPYFGIAVLVLLLGLATGFLMTLSNEEWFFAFVGGDMAAGRTPDATTAFLEQGLHDFDPEDTPTLKAFAGMLFSRNAAIGMMCFALGFAFGIPVVLLVFSNAASLGAMFALYAQHGLFTAFLGWVSIHGVTEFGALLLCAAAGLMLGKAMAFPGRVRRVDALAEAGRKAAVLAVGAVAMFLVAAMLEGFGRQLIDDDASRLMIAAASLALWTLYATMAGRRGAD